MQQPLQHSPGVTAVKTLSIRQSNVSSVSNLSRRTLYRLWKADASTTTLAEVRKIGYFR